MMNDLASHQTVLIGLDGATFSILNPLMQNGVMPFLHKYARQGVRAVLNSTSHPLTPPAWTSLMTGRTPGNHGVFDFVRVDKQSQRPGYTLTTSVDNQAETIWSIASRQGCRVTALNYPCMFPPPQINGFVVPGFVPWSYLSRAVHPRELYPRLKALPGFNARELAMDFAIERKSLQGMPEEQFEDWIRFHTVREQHWFEIIRFLMQHEPCDLTAVLFDGVDKLQHLCYHLLDPQFSSLYDSAWARHIRELCLNFFRQLDGFLEQIVAMAPPLARVFIVSDHGFTLAGNKIFYANVWLEKQGYLAWADDIPMDEKGHVNLEGFAETGTLFDWSQTIAFSMTPSSNAIFIRVAKSSGEPGIAPEQYYTFRQQLLTDLMTIMDPDTGQSFIEHIFTREEAFGGAYTDMAPDLTLMMRDRGLLSILRADAVFKPRASSYGTHERSGIFLGYGPGIRKDAEVAALSIIDVAPTVLYSLGLPVPSHMEGIFARSAFEESYVCTYPIRADEATGHVDSRHDGQMQQAFDSEGEALIRERLKALGYLA